MAAPGYMSPVEEFECLKGVFGGSPIFRDAVVTYGNGRFFHSRQTSYRTERRGEVVFAVERPSGRFVITRMKEYPDGIYRLPSGGISYGEEIIPALEREIMEELGLRIEVVSFLGAIRYDIRYGKESAAFASYVFHVREIGGRIMVDAIDDEVSEYAEVDAVGLRGVADSLRNIVDSWRDWGRFRAVAVDFAADALITDIQP